MMRSDWRIAAVAAALMTVTAACGGHGTNSLENDNGGGDPNPSESPQPNGAPAVIEFVPPTDDEAPASDGATVFQPSIGPIGSSNPQGSLIRFRILNAEGKPARNNLRVLFSIVGPPDATLTLTKDHSKDGFVETVLRAGATSGKALVVAQIFETNLIARSAVVLIGSLAGPAASIEFFGLRTPGLLGGAEDEPGTPQSRTLLGIRGSGKQSVDVVFAVFDQQGGAAADGTVVDFTLFGPNGGEFITPTTTESVKGFVSATVNTGTRPGAVEITAKVRGTSLQARAIPITIGSTLNPAGTHLSIAARCLNVAGSVTFGIRDQIRAGLSDQFGNQIPVGSAVSFFAEGGAVFAQGLSADGIEALADLVTQLPIPDNRRVQVMAVTVGQETFTDQNGNNVYDVGEPFVDQAPEAYLDENESGVYDLGEVFLDANNNGVYDSTPNGQWDAQIPISAQMPIVFSGHTTISIEPQTFSLDALQTQAFEVIVSDEIGSALTGITTITVTSTKGEVIPSETFGVPDTNVNTLVEPILGITRFTVLLTNTNEPPAEGETLTPRLTALTVKVDSPIGKTNETECPGGNGSVNATITGFISE